MKTTSANPGFRTIPVDAILAGEWLRCTGNYSGQRQLSSNAPSDMRVVWAGTPEDRPWLIEFICCSTQWEQETEIPPFPEFELVMSTRKDSL